MYSLVIVSGSTIVTFSKDDDDDDDNEGDGKIDVVDACSMDFIVTGRLGGSIGLLLD